MPGKSAAAFRALQEKLGDPRPDQTGDMLGVWPPEGEHECYVVRIEEDQEAKFLIKYDDKKSERTEVGSSSYRFWYQLTDDPDNPDNPLTWGGQPFNFPDELTDDFPSNKLTQVRMDRNRLCGHLKCLLGIEVGGERGLPEDDAIEKVKALLGGDSEIIALIKCQFTTGRKREGQEKAPVYQKEFCQKNLTPTTGA